MLVATAGSSFGPCDVPPLASLTYTTILSSFCLTGQVQTALVRRVACYGRFRSKTFRSLLRRAHQAQPSRVGGYA